MNWAHSLWFGYFWPSLQGNGPEALVQTVVYGAIALLFVPPVRRWMARHVADLKAHVSAEQDALHQKLDHIIKHHPDIPDLKSKKARPQL